MTDANGGAKVENYILYAGNGRRIRIATKVVYPDGTQVEFVERMSKREALRQVAKHQELRSR